MVNSSWTSGHIEHLWTSKNVLKIFPPCDIKGFLQFSIEERFKKANKLILSIGQFRPEKNHSLQVCNCVLICATTKLKVLPV